MFQYENYITSNKILKMILDKLNIYIILYYIQVDIHK